MTGGRVAEGLRSCPWAQSIHHHPGQQDLHLPQESSWEEGTLWGHQLLSFLCVCPSEPWVLCSSVFQGQG